MELGKIWFTKRDRWGGHYKNGSQKCKIANKESPEHRQDQGSEETREGKRNRGWGSRAKVGGFTRKKTTKAKTMEFGKRSKY